jgi:hypothetical protein
MLQTIVHKSFARFSGHGNMAMALLQSDFPGKARPSN